MKAGAGTSPHENDGDSSTIGRAAGDQDDQDDGDGDCTYDCSGMWVKIVTTIQVGQKAVRTIDEELDASRATGGFTGRC